MTIRQETAALIQSSAAKTQGWHTFSTNLDSGGVYQNEVDTCASIILRACRELESNLFVVLVFGPLKSGKSTLVNCLLRRECSPTRLGISGTKRPSIILGMAVETATAAQFFPTPGAVGPSKVRFERVIDFLREVIPREALTEVQIRPVVPFERVVEKLCEPSSEADSEPLITALYVPETTLLRKGVAIVDSPGFDDPTVSQNTPEIEWAVENADLCILVHSSLAAPNQGLLELLKDALARESAPPLWIIQNRFEARQWRTTEVTEVENGTQQKATLGLVKECLGSAASAASIESRWTNLGFAEDKRLRPHNIDASRARELGLDDNLESIEQEIITFLEKDRVALKEITGLRRLAARVEACKTSLERVRKAAETELEEFTMAGTALAESLKEIQGVVYFSGKHSFRSVEDFIDTEHNRWLLSLKSTIPPFRSTYGNGTAFFRDRIPPSEVDTLCQQTAKTSLSPTQAKVFLIPGLTTLMPEVHEEFAKSEAEVLQNINKTLSGLGLAQCPVLPTIARDAMPKPELGIFEPPPLKTRNLLMLGLVEKRYNTSEAEQYWRTCLPQAEALIQQCVATFQEQFKAFCMTHAETRRAALTAHVERQMQEFTNKWAPRLRLLGDFLAGVEGMLKDLDAIGIEANAVRNTLASKLSSIGQNRPPVDGQKPAKEPAAA